MHRSFRLTHNPPSVQKRRRWWPIFVQTTVSLCCLAAGVMAWAALDWQTENLDIFPEQKRMLGAFLCGVVCLNAAYLPLHPLKFLIRKMGILSADDSANLTHFVDRWPSE